MYYREDFFLKKSPFSHYYKYFDIFPSCLCYAYFSSIFIIITGSLTKEKSLGFLVFGI